MSINETEGGGMVQLQGVEAVKVDAVQSHVQVYKEVVRL